MSYFFLSLIILIYPGFIVKLEACGVFPSWPSVPGCALFGSILVRHRLTPGRLSMHRELFLVATAFTDDQGSSGQAIVEYPTPPIGLLYLHSL